MAIDVEELDRVLAKNRANFIIQTVLGYGPDDDISNIDKVLHENLLGVILSVVPNRDALALSYKYGLTGDGKKYTHEEVGFVLGFTRERSRQIIKRCMTKLRHPKIINQLVIFKPQD